MAKRVRSLPPGAKALQVRLKSLQREGLALDVALERILAGSNPSETPFNQAVRMLNSVRPGAATKLLLDRFFTAEEPGAIQSISSALFQLSDHRATRALASAMNDPVEARRIEASYLLAFCFDRRAVPHLECAFEDPAQLLYVRETSAEGLGYLQRPRSIPVLEAGLKQPIPNLRFWCTFALGSFTEAIRGGTHAARIRRALESVLEDDAEMPGYWGIGLEALAMLGTALPHGKHRGEFLRQLREFEGAATMSKAQRRWLDWYGRWADDRAAKVLSTASTAQ